MRERKLGSELETGLRESTEYIVEWLLKQQL
jgi:hypothetical protein